MKDRSWPSEKRNGAISAEQRIKGSKTHQVKEFRLREEGKKKLRRRTGGTLLDRTDRVPFSPIKMAHFLAGPDTRASHTGNNVSGPHMPYRFRYAQHISQDCVRKILQIRYRKKLGELAFAPHTPRCYTARCGVAAGASGQPP
jgi:hypothetical protein